MCPNLNLSHCRLQLTLIIIINIEVHYDETLFWNQILLLFLLTPSQSHIKRTKATIACNDQGAIMAKSSSDKMFHNPPNTWNNLPDQLPHYSKRRWDRNPYQEKSPEGASLHCTAPGRTPHALLHASTGRMPSVAAQNNWRPADQYNYLNRYEFWYSEIGVDYSSVTLLILFFFLL